MSQEGVLLSQYALKRTLQTSQFGSVILAESRSTSELVVIKLSCKYLAAAASKTRSIECPLNEQAIYEQILQEPSDHPGRANVVNALSFDEDKISHWLVLEHCERGDLLDQCRKMDLPRAKHLFRQMLRGVAYLHSIGIVHRDLSPENVFLTKDDVCKIGDFGQAVSIERSKERELSLQRAGKAGYMSPEALAGAPVDAVASDVFSLGVCLFVMLTGSPPWQEATNDDASFYYIRRGHLAKIVHLWGFSKCVPPLAVHLLSGMFLPQNQRLSLNEVMCHPFLASELSSKKRA